MNVTLTPDLEQIVREKIETGGYQSALEVIGDALRLMTERETNRQIQIEKLRQEIAIGIEQCERGEVFDGEEVVQELLEEIDRAEREQQ
jgi:antitoxin ParD1/3/4